MKINEIWRYPVKSMLGERLDQAGVGLAGLDGDRHRAVVDAGSGVSLSAKRYPELLSCRAWTTDVRVIIGFPDGEEFAADSPEAAECLSQLLNRRVVVRAASVDQKVQHEFPTEIETGEGEPFIWEPGLEAFFDRSPLHLLTTATLRELSRRQPGSDFVRARFRPNFIVETDETGFVEDGWVGRDLSLGPLQCHVLDRKPRCVMTTHAQSDLPKDNEVIRTIVKENDGNAGIELRALGPGTLNAGDLVSLLD
jgi:uncharacterized protein YcbX